jgi:carbamate kinase
LVTRFRPALFHRARVLGSGNLISPHHRGSLHLQNHKATVHQPQNIAGSMGPKIEALCRFVEATGKLAAIGRLADAQALVHGQAGTTIAVR